MGRLIQMIVSQLLRYVVKRGVQSGVTHLTGKTAKTPGAQDKSSKQVARKARQAANLARRIGR